MAGTKRKGKRKVLEADDVEVDGDELGEKTPRVTGTKKIQRAVMKRGTRISTAEEETCQAEERTSYLTELQALSQDSAMKSEGDKPAKMRARAAMTAEKEAMKAKVTEKVHKYEEYIKEQTVLRSGARDLTQDPNSKFKMQPSHARNKARSSRPSVQQSFRNGGLMHFPPGSYSTGPGTMPVQPPSERYVLAGLSFPPLPRRDVGQQLRPLPRGPPPTYLAPPNGHGRLPYFPERSLGLERNPFADLDVSFLNRPNSAHGEARPLAGAQPLTSTQPLAGSPRLALPAPFNPHCLPNSAGLGLPGGSLPTPIFLSPARPGSSFFIPIFLSPVRAGNHKPPISVSPVRPGTSHHKPTFPLPYSVRRSSCTRSTVSHSTTGFDESLPRRVVTAPNEFDNLRLAPILYPNPLIKEDESLSGRHPASSV